MMKGSNESGDFKSPRVRCQDQRVISLAERIGVIQSLLVTCRLQGIDPYAYLVDVLLRISVHPASQVLDLTPRRWKEKFAHRPMQSDLALADQ